MATELTKDAKIANPPSLGVLSTCTLRLLSGTSSNLFLNERNIIGGMEKEHTTNDQKKAKTHSISMEDENIPFYLINLRKDTLSLGLTKTI